VASINVKSVFKHFGNLDVIKNVSFNIQSEEIVCLLGPSGCGKTTLLKIIARLIAPSSGTVTIVGTFGIVFQEPRLLDWLTVEKNLEIPYLVCGKKVNGERIKRMLNIVKLNEFKQFYPLALSIGMQQRVALVRALLFDPDILLLDEPFRGLDVKIRESLEDDILLLSQSGRKSVLFVTHSIEEAIRVADKVIVVSRRPMKVLNTIQMPFGSKPRNAYSVEFLPFEKQIYDCFYQTY